MSLTLLSRPILSGCNWNAAGNPIIYKLRRKDHDLNAINDNAGDTQLQINGSNLTAYYQVGNIVRIYDNTDLTLYEEGEITVSSFSGGNTLITLDLPYSASIDSTYDFVNNISKRTDYKIDVDFHYASDNTRLASNGERIAVSPDGLAIMTLNASTFVKNFVSAEWVYPSAVNEADEQASIKFYITYQEFYDGAYTGSPTSDSANPVHAVFAAMQIGYPYGSNMDAFFPEDDTKRWLTRFANPAGSATILYKLPIWRDWPFTLSFIYKSGLSSAKLNKYFYDVSGALLSSSVVSLASESLGRVHRIDPQIPGFVAAAKTLRLELGTEPAQPAGYTDPVAVSDDDFTIGTGPGAVWSNVGAGGSWVGSGGTVSASLTATPTKIFQQDLNTSLILRYLKIDLEVTIPVGTTAAYKAFINNDEAGTTAPTAGTGSPATVTMYLNYGNETGANDLLGFLAEKTAGANGTVSMHSVTITEGFFSEILSPIEIDIRDACEVDEDLELVHEKNPIHLFWKNSEGGDAYWNFSTYHEYTYNYSGKKAKRIILFETSLHPLELEALEELKSIGEVYQVPIIDLENTNTINKTSQRVGQQVYILSQDGETKTGVIVIPASDTSYSRDTTHNFSVEIELPEVQSI